MGEQLLMHIGEDGLFGSMSFQCSPVVASGFLEGKSSGSGSLGTDSMPRPHFPSGYLSSPDLSKCLSVELFLLCFG
jgi:hypothetical protein